MELQEIKSSTISKVGYDAGTKIMIVVFHSGSTYEFENIPQEIYYDFIQAKSFGKFFAQRIRPSYIFKKVQ